MNWAIRRRLLPLIAMVACVVAAQPVAAAALRGVVDGLVVEPAGEVVVSVYLDQEGSEVVGTQSDLGIPAPFTVRHRPNGRPDCEVNPDIDKGGTAFSELVLPCPSGGCTALRAIVLALDNVEVIADGARLFTCHLDVAADAPAGTFLLPFSNLAASNADGEPLPLRGEGAEVIVGVVDRFAGVEIADVAGEALVPIPVVVRFLGGAPILDLTNVLRYAPEAFIIGRGDGSPACQLADGIDATARFTFDPPECVAGETCTGVQVELDLAQELAANADLYRCDVRIRATAEAGSTWSLDCEFAMATDAAGHGVAIDCRSGSVRVLGATPTLRPTATAVPGTVVAATPTATGQVQRTVTPTVDVCGACPRGFDCMISNGGALCIPGDPSDDDSCAVVRPGRMSGAGLLPIIVLLVLRRRLGRDPRRLRR